MTVSVITPAYNIEKHIGKCIDSVIAQTYTDWELIVAVSPSMDKTEEIVRDYTKKDPRIHIIVVPKSNCATARNIGISHAKGEYIAMLDGDDWFVPRKLNTLVQYLEENPKIRWVSSYLNVIYEPKDTRCTNTNHINQVTDRPGFCPGLMGVHTVLFRKSVFDRLKSKDGYVFNETMNRGDDGDLMLRIRKIPSYHIHEYLTNCYAMIIKNGAWDLLPPRIKETFVRQTKKIFNKVGL